MRIKDDSISLSGFTAQILFAVQVAEGAYRDVGVYNAGTKNRDMGIVLTSANDGRHSLTSLHYVGHAVDIRTRHLVNPEKVRDEIKSRLNQDFDVLFEGDHIHIEWQPRRRDK